MTEGEVALMLLASAALWVIFQSPLLRWLSVFVVFSAWGVGTVGATLFVILAIHVPAGHYGAAVMTLVFGGILSAFWFFSGLPFLINHCKELRTSCALWEKQ
jgi:hypothetical protein